MVAHITSNKRKKISFEKKKKKQSPSGNTRFTVFPLDDKICMIPLVFRMDRVLEFSIPEGRGSSGNVSSFM